MWCMAVGSTSKLMRAGSTGWNVSLENSGPRRGVDDAVGPAVRVFKHVFVQKVLVGGKTSCEAGRAWTATSGFLVLGTRLFEVCF